MPDKKHLRGASSKEQRQYEHILESAKEEGRYGNRAKEVAARTVMKQHAEDGHEPHGSGSSRTRKKSSSKKTTTKKTSSRRKTSKKTATKESGRNRKATGRRRSSTSRKKAS